MKKLLVSPMGEAVVPGRLPKTRKAKYPRLPFPTACVFQPFPARGDLVPLPHRTGPSHLGRDFGQMGLGQSGAHTAGRIIDVVAIDVDISVIVYVGGIIRIVAKRPQPPPRSRTTKTPDKRHSAMRFRTKTAFCRC